MNKAIFSDMDGTLISTKSGKKFPIDKDDWQLKTDVLDSIYRYMNNNLMGLLCVVTNQGGVELGIISKEDMDSKVLNVKNAIEEYFIITHNYRIFVDYGICYTNNKREFSRKPNPGLGYLLALRNNLSLSRCIMIGDASGIEGNHSSDDVDFANNCVMNYFDVDTFVTIYNVNSNYMSFNNNN